jgi:hypothetical protein
MTPMVPRRIPHLAAVIALACVATAGLPAGQRDTSRAATPPGSGRISGIVVTTGTPSRPLRRVTVVVSTGAGSYGARLTVTDDEGRFTVGDLPAGRYLVSASKPAYLPTAYGVARPLRSTAAPTGTAIVLGDAQHVSDVVLRMSRGGVVSGTIRSMVGAPVRGVQVMILHFARDARTGARSLAPVPDAAAHSDSRGAYRIFGLPPGEYLVMARVFPGLADLELTTDADLQRVNDGWRSGASIAGAGSMPAPPRRRPKYGLANVFHPGTTNVADAATIALPPGEERHGVDLRMELVPNSTITGTVVGPDGRPGQGQAVRLISDLSPLPPLVMGASSDAEGRFRLAGVPPGIHTLTVRPAAGRGSTATPLWGRVEAAVVPGQDSDVIVNLQPAMTMTGRIVVESSGAALAPPDLARVRVQISSEEVHLGTLTAAADPDGRFTLTGLSPSRYRFVVTVPAAETWHVQSATIGGIDALDQAVDIGAGIGSADVAVTLSDRGTELSGALRDRAGQPAPEYFIIAFPADRSLWTWRSRRIQQTRPGHDGSFAFRNLPPGDYRMAAVTDVEENEWYEPAFLETLLPASFALTLAEGERKIQHIQVR